MSRKSWIFLLFLSTLFSSVPVMAEDSLDQSRRVRQYMREVTADLDQRMAKMDSSEQAEFRLLVKRDLSVFEFEMERAGMDSAQRHFLIPLADCSDRDAKVDSHFFHCLTRTVHINGISPHFRQVRILTIGHNRNGLVGTSQYTLKCFQAIGPLRKY